MSYLLAFIIVSLCVLGMSAGLLLARKTLKKGCSDNPDDCACRQEGKDPAACEN